MAYSASFAVQRDQTSKQPRNKEAKRLNRKENKRFLRDLCCFVALCFLLRVKRLQPPRTPRTQREQRKSIFFAYSASFAVQRDQTSKQPRNKEAKRLNCKENKRFLCDLCCFVALCFLLCDLRVLCAFVLKGLHRKGRKGNISDLCCLVVLCFFLCVCPDPHPKS